MEIYKDIRGYNGIYRVSNEGNVRTIGKSGTWRKDRVLKPYRHTGGYLVVTLYKSHSVKSKYFVHRLVANSFIKNPGKRQTVNHIDGNKRNNILSNLEWATYKENLHHARENGLTRNHGEQQKTAKLKESDVIEIRHLYAKGTRVVEIIRKYRLNSVQTVYNIIKRKSWKHI